MDVPTLYIVGSSDTGHTIPGMRDIIAGQRDLVPQLRDPVFLEGVGHLVPQEQPDTVIEALQTFLAAITH